MTRINVRQKGADGEREVCNLLQPTVDHVANEFGIVAPRLRRNLMQYSVGGEDIVGLPWYSLEVKRVEKLDLAKWWEQAVAQAGRKEAGASAWDDLAAGGWRRLGQAPGRALPSMGGWRPREATGGRRAAPGDLQAAARRLPVVLYRQNGTRAWSALLGGAVPSLGGAVPCVVSVAQASFLAWLETDLRARLQSVQ